MTDLLIRPYLADDQQSVVALWTACGLVAPHNSPVRDIERKLEVAPELFLVGVLGGEIVATCMVGYEGHRGWINYLAVSPQHRRSGIGTKIMQEAERRLREMGCPKINLQVRTSNREVIEFYKSMGFLEDAVVSLGKRLEHDEPYGVEQSGAAP